MLATCPGHNATVLVAFALTGGMPTKSKAGNETKLPPPATELMAPASRAAKKRIVAWEKFMRAMCDGNRHGGSWGQMRRHAARRLPSDIGRIGLLPNSDPPECAWIQALRGGGCGKHP